MFWLGIRRGEEGRCVSLTLVATTTPPGRTKRVSGCRRKGSTTTRAYFSGGRRPRKRRPLTTRITTTKNGGINDGKHPLCVKKKGVFFFFLTTIPRLLLVPYHQTRASPRIAKKGGKGRPYWPLKENKQTNKQTRCKRCAVPTATGTKPVVAIDREIVWTVSKLAVATPPQHRKNTRDQIKRNKAARCCYPGLRPGQQARCLRAAWS